MTQHAQEPPQAPGAASVSARPVRVLALVAAALAVVFYLLGFVRNTGTIDLVDVLVIGGGLLGGCAALPRSGRLVVPAAVMALLGTLALVQGVAAGGLTARLTLALLVGALQTLALLVALLIETGVVGAAGSAARRPAAGNAPQPAWPPVQSNPPAQAGVDPTITYVGHPGGMAFGGQPSFDAAADPATVVGGMEPAGQQAGAASDMTVVGGRSPFGGSDITVVGRPLFGSEPTSATANPGHAAAEAGTAVARPGQPAYGSADPATTAVVRGTPFGAEPGTAAVARGEANFGAGADPAPAAQRAHGGAATGTGEVTWGAQAGFGDPLTSKAAGRGARSVFGGAAENGAAPVAQGDPWINGGAVDPPTSVAARGAQPVFGGTGEQGTAVTRGAAPQLGEPADKGAAARGAQPAFGGGAEPGAAIARGAQSTLGGTGESGAAVARGAQSTSGGTGESGTAAARGARSASGGTAAIARGAQQMFGGTGESATRGAQPTFGGAADPGTEAVARAPQPTYGGQQPAISATVPGAPSAQPGPVESGGAGAGRPPFSASAENVTAAGQAPFGAQDPGNAQAVAGQARAEGAAEQAGRPSYPNEYGRGQGSFGTGESAVGGAGARNSGVFPVGGSGAAPQYGQQAHGAPVRPGEASVPRYGLSRQAPTGPHATPEHADPARTGASQPNLIPDDAEASRSGAAQASTGSRHAPSPSAETPVYGLSGQGGIRYPQGPEAAQTGLRPGSSSNGSSGAQEHGRGSGGLPSRGANPSGAHRAQANDNGTLFTPSETNGARPFASNEANGASGPSHAAPTGQQPVVGQPKTNGTSGPSHAAQTGEHPVYGLFSAGSRSARRAAAAAARERQTDDRPPRAGGSDAASRQGRAGQEPDPGPASASPGSPSPAGGGEPDPTPATTAFPVQQGRSAADPTPAWGQAAQPDETMVATPGWLDHQNGDGPSAPRTPESRHGSPGRHGQP